MRRAEGYVTGDGSFFESEKEAALYEAELSLRGKLSTEFPDLNQEKFLAVLLTCIEKTGEFIDAYKALAASRTETEDEDGEKDRGGEEAKVDDSLGHVSSTEEDLASLLKLPSRGPEHVPDVGRRPRSKKVQVRRAVDGS